MIFQKKKKVVYKKCSNELNNNFQYKKYEKILKLFKN